MPSGTDPQSQAADTAHQEQQPAPCDTTVWCLLKARPGVIAGILGIGAVLLPAAWMLRRRIAQVVLPAPLLLTAGLIALAALAAVWHIRRWRRPLARLQHAVAQIRQGLAPLDSLASIDGPLACLGSCIRTLLRELQQHKIELALTQQEIRQRVAQRTDALERLVGTLRMQANRDPLTGLYNRRMLDEHLRTVIEKARARNDEMCLLMLDLDNFKALNDTFGHAAGDELLRTVGQLIRSGIREQDLAFRYGGDEFVIVLPGVTAEAGQAMARRLVALVEHLGRTLHTPRPIGLSAGLAVLSQAEQPDAKSLLARADRNLYRFKAARRRIAAPAHAR